MRSSVNVIAPTRRPRNVRRGTHLLTTALIIATLIAGCGGAASKSQQSAPSQEPSQGSSQAPSKDAQLPQEPAPAPEYPLSFVDGLKRPVTLQARPSRIVSVIPAGTEILFALGAGDRVVGVSTYCNYPEQAKQKEKAGGYSNPSVEKVVSLKPDLVLGDFVHGEFATHLGKLGIPVMLLNSQSVAEALDSIKMLGRAIGSRDAAESLCAAMGSRVDEVQKKVGSVPASQRLKVFHELWHEPLMTSGPGTIMDDLIRLAGGINVAADAKTQYPEYSLEMLVAKNPDVIVYTYHYDQRQLKRKGWDNLRAVKQGRVYVLTDDLVSRPGPRIVDGLEELARKLYPDAFK
ncbi:MAG: cobalamin-binding protein [Firmicutes bacterium]|nr:cobalamin-binding protein [Bacillota bacterium]